MLINRACISINNNCNLNCKYCHFHEKEIQSYDMNIFVILDNIMNYIENYKIDSFKLGFVGNGEPLLNYNELKKYILYIKDFIFNNKIKPYIITNGTLVDEEKLIFFKEYKVNLGFSIDGPKWLQDKYRCNSFDKVIKKIELYRNINGYYPTMNATIGKESLEHSEEIINFFKYFKSKITFSRMIGKYGISLKEFNQFIEKVSKEINIRKGGYDCTMYGGLCGVGINNIFYANNKIYHCGNCIDLPELCDSLTPLDKIPMKNYEFDRTKCYKEIIL